jgi:hypothetical protein
MKVFVLMIKARTEEANSKHEQIAGAYVNCFVLEATFERAEEIALRHLRNDDWIPISLEESWEATELDYVDDPKGLEVYKQVLTDKEIYTFHTYEKDED